MTNVISIDANKPYMAGEAICASCRHEWVESAPVGAKELDCPSCGTTKGRFVLFAEPREEFWRCHCDCDIFFILKSGYQCCECAEIQMF